MTTRTDRQVSQIDITLPTPVFEPTDWLARESGESLASAAERWAARALAVVQAVYPEAAVTCRAAGVSFVRVRFADDGEASYITTAQVLEENRIRAIAAALAIGGGSEP